MRRLLLIGLVLGGLALGEPATVSWTPQEVTAVTPVLARDGQPVFLRELYSLRRDEDYRVAAFLGFNATIERGEWTFGPANRAGFWVTEASWYTSHSEDREAVSEARAYRGEPRLIAYNLNDEPDLRSHISPPESLARAAELLRRHDPAARTSVTLAGWGRARDSWPAYARTVDILRVDPYPLVMNQPLSHVFELVRAAGEAAPGKPVVAVLQAWTWPGGPFPNAAQACCMAWQALIAGANGISWFDWNDAEWARHPEFVTALRDLNAELAGPLEPFLLRGRRAPPVRQGDLLAGLWLMPGGDWLILATRVGGDQPLQVRFRLPDGVLRPAELSTFWGTAGLAADGTIVATLPPLGTLAVTTPGPVIRPITPGPPPRRYATDWAGRPWRPVEEGKGVPPCVVPADDRDPFMRDGLSLGIDGPLAVTNGLNGAGPVFRAAPGTVLHYRLSVTPADLDRAAVRLLSWHDHSREITDGELGRYATVSPGDAPGTWEVTVHPPADRSYDTSRDHLLTFELAWRREGHAYSTRRVVRFRLEPAAQLSWKWLSESTGEVAFEPALAPELYAVPLGDWTLGVSAHGVRVTPLSSGSRTLTVALSPEGAPADRLLSLHGSVTAGGVELAGGGLDSFYAADGRLIRGETRNPVAEADRLEPLDMEGPWKRLWAAADGLKPCRHFVYQGSRSFTGKPTRAWFGWDDTCLYWFMEVPLGWYTAQAQTTEPDSSFLSDDVAFLMLQTAPPPDSRAFMIQLNARGVSWQAQLAPSFDLGWSPQLVSRHRVAGQTWRFVAALRWSELGLEQPPTALEMNLGVAQGIAPRVRATWHYWGRPFRPADSLGRLELRRPASE